MSTLTRAAELYKRLMIMAEKREFNATEVEFLTAMMLASAMLNGKPMEEQVIRRVVRQAREFIDAKMLIEREPT